MKLDAVEWWVRRFGAAAVLIPLGIALWGVGRTLHRPPDRAPSKVYRVLFARVFVIVASVLWFGLCFMLWRPVPLTLSTPARVVALTLGILFYFPGLALYLWGAGTLGEMHRASSAFGVQLNADHRLITHGPFALVRHPLYLGLQVAALGGLLIYRTWTLVFVVANCPGLFFRARREEQALATEFGRHWETYCHRVPAWLPRLRRRTR